MTTVPAWYPDAEESKPAPAPLLLVQAFVNTRDLEAETDVLGDTDAAKAWLVAAGLVPAAVPLRPADLDLARALRENIRSLLVSDRGERRQDAEPDRLRELAQAHRARLTIDDRGVFAVENPKHDDLADGLFDLLLIIRAAQQDGTWTRMRACANPDCRWVFYDRSRNQQGNWCDMAVCGNRLKNRNLRARRRRAPAPGVGPSVTDSTGLKGKA
jgi:predicted RNA-binding Zn ribbon-like protein